MYMDRHDAPGISPEELADLHTRDIAVQERHSVRYHTYWFDPANGSVFCLAEGPTQQAVEAVHQEAHGQTASTIVEIDPNVPLNAMLGARPEYPPGTPYEAPAMRAIVFTDLCGSVEQTSQLGDEGHLALLRVHNTIVREQLNSHDGREVKHTGDGIMASFDDTTAAVECARAIQQAFDAFNLASKEKLRVRIGMDVGEPVADSNDLFGTTVQMAARLCQAAEPGAIWISDAVRKLVCNDFEPVDLGPRAVKGFATPVPMYAVEWR
jgi:class 3 adenylate cyclase